LADRTPIFEMHILPMFRQLDRQHMMRVNSTLDLWDYDSVKRNAPEIIARACGDTPSMPPSDVGGFWPSEWRALFSRWVAGGFRRLTLGLGRDYKLTQSGATLFTLSCTAAIPNATDGDSTAWFDTVDPGPGSATFRLYVFPGEAVPPPADTTDIQVQEHVAAASAVGGVTVIDSAGTHRIARPEHIA
jgi:hypothetical protein